MEIQKFESPIVVSLDAAHDKTLIVDIAGSIEFLLKKWPGKRGDRHREALQACVDAKAQKTSVHSARRAFVAAARQAGILLGR
jgi:hypothetical protein